VYEHFARRDVAAEYASFDFLFDGERAILEELRPRLGEARMLDLGVGGGRTTAHFAPAVRQYVGVDVSAPMVEACVERFAGALGDHVSFGVADARDLATFEAGSFDFVLFSFNGLDLVGGEDDRLRALREIHRVLADGGVFCFSSHNLAFTRRYLSPVRSLARVLRDVRGDPAALVRRPRTLLDAIGRPLRERRLNPALRSVLRAGRGLVAEERPRFELDARPYVRPGERIVASKYRILPGEQLAQLRDVGFRGARIFAVDGTELSVRRSAELAEHMWLHYLCEKGPPGGA